MRKMTDIERALARILQEEKLTYAREHRLGTYPVDFYLRKYNLTLQADGCYHHGCPSCYKGKTLEARQKKQILKDKACIGFHKHYKINIIRIYGCLILEKEDYVRGLIRKVISGIKEGNKFYIFNFEDN